jgi:hypothetical protein
MSHFISSLGEYTHTALAVESLTIYSTSYIYYAQPLNGRDAGSSSAGLPQYQYGGLSLTVGPESGGDLFFLSLLHYTLHTDIAAGGACWWS